MGLPDRRLRWSDFLPGFEEAAPVAQPGERVVAGRVVLAFEAVVQRVGGGEEEDGEAGEGQVVGDGEGEDLLHQVGEKARGEDQEGARHHPRVAIEARGPERPGHGSDEQDAAGNEHGTDERRKDGGDRGAHQHRDLQPSRPPSGGRAGQRGHQFEKGRGGAGHPEDIEAQKRGAAVEAKAIAIPVTSTSSAEALARASHRWPVSSRLRTHRSRWVMATMR